MPASNRRTPRNVDVRPPISELPAIVGATVGAVVAYLIAESAFASSIHPLHWIIAVGGGLLGLVLGYVVARAMNR